MENASIMAAFERIWQHVASALATKADANDLTEGLTDIQTQVDNKANSTHNHTVAHIPGLQNVLDEKVDTETLEDALSTKSAIRIVTWGEND
jgi:hypothetical protein